MKSSVKLYHLLITAVLAVSLSTCVENHVLPDFGKIYVSTNPPGAAIYLNGENTGKVTPDSLLELLSGEYTISLKLQAYTDSNVTIQLGENQRINIDVELNETNPQGLIVLNSDPQGAQIWLDGNQTGSVTPDSVFALLREDHTVTLKLQEFKDTTLQIDFNNIPRLEYDIFMKETNPQGEITVTSVPSGADVLLNGKETGEVTPAVFSGLERGKYEFQLSLDLYELALFEVELQKDQKLSRNIDLVVAGSSGTLFVNSDPANAQIFLNNINTGKVTPDTIKPLTPGNYDVKLSLAQYRDTTITTSVSAGSITSENVILTFYEPRGSISLDSNPEGAEIFIDGSTTNQFTPAKIRKLEAGNYSITLKLDAYFDTTFTVQVNEDQNTDVPTVQMQIIPYFINVTVSPEDGGTVTGEGEYSPGERVTLLATPNTGYNFVNWTENGNEIDTSRSISFNAERDRNLAANFRLKTYEINGTVNPPNSGFISGVGVYNHGDIVELSASPSENYLFLNWMEGESIVSTNADYSFTAVSNRELTANFNGIGNLAVSSDPIGANITLNNEFTGQKTPHEFVNIIAGTYSVKLDLEDFADTTIITEVVPGETTDLGAVFLRDTTSAVEVQITYDVNQVNQRITFFFVFNQDIRFSRVEVSDPNGTFFQFPFNNQLFPQGIAASVGFPEKIEGEWSFTCIGAKVHGRQTSFNITESVTVN